MGTKHINECPLLLKQRATIALWKINGYMRTDLYSNSTQIKNEGTMLNEAYSIILSNIRSSAM